MTDPDLLSNADIAELLKLIPFLRMWADTVEGHALSILLHGGTLPGYKLVSGRTNRVWANEAAVTEWLVYETSVAEAMPRKLVSPAQAEKLLRDHRIKNWKSLVGEYTTYNVGPPTIARETDPRPVVEAFGEFQAADESGPAAEILE